jgi:hypothetical protein
MEKLVYTLLEAGKMLGVCRSETYHLPEIDGFPYFKIGKRFYVPSKQLEEWVLELGKNNVKLESFFKNLHEEAAE